MSKPWLVFVTLLVMASLACVVTDQLQPTPDFPIPTMMAFDTVTPTSFPTLMLPTPFPTLTLPSTLPPSWTPLATFTWTSSPTATSTNTLIPSATFTPSPFPSLTPSATFTATWTSSPTATPTDTLTPSATFTPSITPTETASLTPTPMPFTLNMWLAAPVENPDGLAQAQTLVTDRLTQAGIHSEVLIENDQLRIRTAGTAEDMTLLGTHVGWVEIVDFSFLSGHFVPTPGTCVMTTSQVARYPNQDICVISELSPVLHPNGEPFKTLVTRDEVGSITVGLGSLTSPYMVNVRLQPAATEALAAFSTERVGEQIGVLLDGEVLGVISLSEPITDGQLSVPVNWTVQQSNDLTIILQSPPLPLALAQVGLKSFPEGDEGYVPPSQ